MKKLAPVVATTQQYQGARLAWTVVVFLAAALTVISAAPTAGAAALGPAPEFRLPLLAASGTISLADLKNRPAVLLFWAPW